MTEGILTDSANVPIKLLSRNVYRTIDTSCNGNGIFGDSGSGYCFCNSGYAGTECQYCAIGFDNLAPAGKPYICKQKMSDGCYIDTCGCDPTSPSTCRPLGTCNKGQCSCPLQYTGPTCNECAEGYTNYPKCTKIKGCPFDFSCTNGKCVATQCICDNRWAGNSCDECAEGWTGDGCSSPVQGQTPPPGGSNEYTKLFNNITILGIILASLAILATVAFLVYRRVTGQHKRLPLSYFALDDEDAAELADLDENANNDDDLPTITSGSMKAEKKEEVEYPPKKTTSQIKEELFSISDDNDKEEDTKKTSSEEKLISP